MRIYPAIDLKEGKCVRLIQGDYEAVTIYGEDPLAVAKKWETEGASYLHLVDLDGAKAGRGINSEIIIQIAQTIKIPVQVGGGIRTLEQIRYYLENGVARVILGSIVLEQPFIVEKALDIWGSERIIVGIDAKAGKVAINGWLQVTSCVAIALGKQLKEKGIKKIVYTDIAKDGMLQGPNQLETKQMLEMTGLEVIASGGVATLEQLEALSKIGVEGVIIGKALYTGAIPLETAVKRFERG